MRAFGSPACTSVVMNGYATAARSIRRMLIVSAALMKIIVHDSLSSVVFACGGVSCCRVVATSHMDCFKSSNRRSGLCGSVSLRSLSW